MTKPSKTPLTGYGFRTLQFGVGYGKGFAVAKRDIGFGVEATCITVPKHFRVTGGKNTLDHYVVVGMKAVEDNGESDHMSNRWLALDPDAAVAFATEILEQASNARYARERNPRFGGEE